MYDPQVITAQQGTEPKDPNAVLHVNVYIATETAGKRKGEPVMIVEILNI